MAKDQVTESKISPISDEILEEVIDLARLDPFSQGIVLQKEHLVRILKHFEILNQVDLGELSPTIQINPTTITLREDEVVDRLSREEALSNARMRTDEFFQVPGILGDEESESA